VYVNMAAKNAHGVNIEYGSRGTIESPLYNPTPPYSNDPKSLYYQSCQVCVCNLCIFSILLIVYYI